MSEKESSKLSATKEKCWRVHTKVSEVVEGDEELENGISMLVNHNSKQNKKTTSHQDIPGQILYVKSYVQWRAPQRM